MLVKAERTAYLTPRKTYVIACPSCRRREELHASGVPHADEPYQYECPCGQHFPIRLVSFRTAPRKAVSLSGVLVASVAEGMRRLPCTIENLSLKGMALRTEPILGFRPRTLRVLALLPGRIKRALDASCIVRRATLDRQHLHLAVEFQRLAPEQQESLQSYLRAS